MPFNRLDGRDSVLVPFTIKVWRKGGQQDRMYLQLNCVSNWVIRSHLLHIPGNTTCTLCFGSCFLFYYTRGVTHIGNKYSKRTHFAMFYFCLIKYTFHKLTWNSNICWKCSISFRTSNLLTNKKHKTSNQRQFQSHQPHTSRSLFHADLCSDLYCYSIMIMMIKIFCNKDQNSTYNFITNTKQNRNLFICWSLSSYLDKIAWKRFSC